MCQTICRNFRLATTAFVSVLLVSTGLYSYEASAQLCCGEQFGIAFSNNSNRVGGNTLNGATVSGDIYVFTSPLIPQSTILRVKWYLDAPVNGNFFFRDTAAPYDFQGGTVALANAFDTTTIPDGVHTITAQIVFAGSPRVKQVVSSTFTVNNSGPPVGPEPWEFGVADLPDRLGANAALFPDPAGVLELLFGQVFIFIGESSTCTLASCIPAPNGDPPPPEIVQVTFTFDIDTPAELVVNTDTAAPFDLGVIGDVGPNDLNAGFNLDLLAFGEHTLTATIEIVGGDPVILTRSFLAQPLFVALPPTLKGVEVLEDPQLAEDAGIISDRAMAIALGKAFFWDLQTGGDGRQACASCHYHAGVDNRILNTVNPMSGGFDVGSSGPGGTLTTGDFPFHQFADPLDRGSAIVRSIDDVVGSQGLLQKDFAGINVGSDADSFTDPASPDLNFVDNSGTAHRRSTGRNTPTNINAIFNVRNFWDGRANFVFNGASPFGARDSNAKVYVNSGAGTASVPTDLRIRFASLASQAVGPPNNDVEMSYKGRTFPELGRKLLNLQPLAKQLIASDDSVLGAGPLGCLIAGGAAPPNPCVLDGMGLEPSYSAMIMAAFDPIYWAGADVVIDGVTYTQMEANFSMFWGLGIQLWEATLISDDSKWDRFRDGTPEEQQAKIDLALALLAANEEPGAVADNTTVDVGGTLVTFSPDDILTNAETRGMQNFLGGECNVCHAGAVLTAATTPFLLGPAVLGEPPEQVVERMLMEQGLIALEAGLPPPSAMYDIGFYNIGVRPTIEDIGLGGMDPWMNPLSFARQLQSGLLVDAGLNAPVAATPEPGILVVDPNLFARDPGVTTINMPVAVNGSFKVPTLRNIALTAPYMHNGGHLTLTDVVAFYARGADFGVENIADLDPAVAGIGNLRGNPAGVQDLVDFMHTFTDPRVLNEAGPFDHPSILLENGISVAETGSAGGPVLPTLDDRLNGPTARADSYVIDVDEVLNGNLLDNDTDGSGDNVQNPMLCCGLSIEGPFFGVLTTLPDPLASNGDFEYTPGPGFRGVDSFAYDMETDNLDDPRSNVARVTIQVGDEIPVANPDTYVTAFNTPLIVTAPGVLDNDTDNDKPSLVATLVDSPVSAASFTLNSDGSFAYTPNPGSSGLDQFTYTADDVFGSSNVATVTIEVEPEVPVNPPCPNDGVSRLCYSLSADRSTPLLLDGATLSGPVYIFISPLFPLDPPVATLKKGVFWVDITGKLGGATKFNADTVAPYDFNGGTVSAANPFNAGTSPLTPGVHTIRAELRFNAGGVPFEVPPATVTVE